MIISWVDWVIVLVMFYFLYRGWEMGLVYLLGDLVVLFTSLWLALNFHTPVGMFLMEKFGIAASWRSVIGYIIVWLAAEITLSEVLHVVVRLLPPTIRASWINRWLGAIVSTINGCILVAFFLLLVLAVPVRGTVRDDIRHSSVGSMFVSYADTYGGNVKSFLDEAAHQAVKFLTIEPGSQERLVLDIVKPEKLTVDEEAEQRMVEMVNQERVKAGVGRLEVDPKITAVARGHSEDMFKRLYFAHVNPEGQSAGDRMVAGGVSFLLAGENIAYAPDVTAAHQGLMESEGHRHNILDPQFHRIGIGVVDGGIWGQMYTQNFAD